MYQQKKCDTTQFETEIFQATRKLPAHPTERPLVEQLEDDTDDPEIYITTRPFNVGMLRELQQSWVAKPEPCREPLVDPNELEQQARGLAREGSMREAGQLADQAFVLRITGDEPDGDSLLASLHLRGGLALRRGDLDSAIERFTEAFQFAEDLVGDSHPHTAACLRNLGAVHRLRGDFEAAKHALAQALRIYSQGCGTEIGTAMTLCCLGNLERARGECTDAIRHYAHARELFDSQPGYGLHPGLASVLHGLGATLLRLGRNCAAKSVLARAHFIRTKTPSTIVQLAGTTLLYGQALWHDGEYMAGHTWVCDAYDIYRRHPSPNPSREHVFTCWLDTHSQHGPYAKAV